MNNTWQDLVVSISSYSVFILEVYSVISFNIMSPSRPSSNKASMAQRPISVGLEWYIAEFRRGVEQAQDCCKFMIYTMSLRVLKKRIGVAVLLWIARNMDIQVGANAELPKDLRKAFGLAQTMIDWEQPCAAVSCNGLPCDTIRQMYVGNVKFPTCMSTICLI